MLEHTPQLTAGQVTDYTLAGVLVASPVWAPWLTDVNAVLTFIGLVIGLILGARRLIRDFKKPVDD